MAYFLNKRAAVSAIVSAASDNDTFRSALSKIKDPADWELRNHVARVMIINYHDHQEAVKAGIASSRDCLPDVQLDYETTDAMVALLRHDGWQVECTKPAFWAIWEQPTVTVVGPPADQI